MTNNDMHEITVMPKTNHVFFYRMVHGFTSGGLLQSQYESSCKGARLGNLSDHYIANGTVIN